MNTVIATLMSRHPFVTFFVLACAFSWWPWPLYTMDLSPSPIVGFGPFLAALVVLPYAHGRAGLMTLLRRMLKWRVGPGWYAVALLLPIIITCVAAGVNVLLGAHAAPGALDARPNLFATFAILLLLPGIGGAWEEPGFRGYAIPHLQARHTALVASLVMGGLWVVWHLPLFLVGMINWSDVVFIPAVAVVYTWMFNSTGGSVLIMMLCHAMNNTISGAFFGPMFAGPDSVRQSWLFAALWCLAAVIVVLVAGSARLSHRPPVLALETASFEAGPSAVRPAYGHSQTPRTAPVA